MHLKYHDDSEEGVSGPAHQQHFVFLEVLERRSDTSVMQESVDSVTNVYTLTQVCLFLTALFASNLFKEIH